MRGFCCGAAAPYDYSSREEMETSRALPEESPGKLRHMVAPGVPSQALCRVALPQAVCAGSKAVRMQSSKLGMSPCSMARSSSSQLGSTTSSAWPNLTACLRSSLEKSTSQLLLKICPSQPCKRPFPVIGYRSILLSRTFSRGLSRITVIVILCVMLLHRLQDGLHCLTLTVCPLLVPSTYSVSSRSCRDASNRSQPNPRFCCND